MRAPWQLMELRAIFQPLTPFKTPILALVRLFLEMVESTAQAMHCKVIYAIVPDDNFRNLDEILERQAEVAAKRLLKKVSHTMALESQEVGAEEKRSQLARLARDLKEKFWKTAEEMIHDRDLFRAHKFEQKEWRC